LILIQLILTQQSARLGRSSARREPDRMFLRASGAGM
jgi:hypothetical protein